MSTPKILVFAGNFEQFKAWLRESPGRESSSDLVYVSSPGSVRGIVVAGWIGVGTYYERRDLVEAMEYVNRRGYRRMVEEEIK